VAGSWFRGRPFRYDPEAQQAAHAGQHAADAWLRRANERASSVAELEAMAALDPGAEYERHRANYIKSGSNLELSLMLEWVR
jgi:hypothetical protein